MCALIIRWPRRNAACAGEGVTIVKEVKTVPKGLSQAFAHSCTPTWPRLRRSNPKWLGVLVPLSHPLLVGICSLSHYLIKVFCCDFDDLSSPLLHSWTLWPDGKQNVTVRDAFPVDMIDLAARIFYKICCSLCCPYTEIMFNHRFTGQVNAGTSRGTPFLVMTTEGIPIEAKNLAVTKTQQKKPSTLPVQGDLTHPSVISSAFEKLSMKYSITILFFVQGRYRDSFGDDAWITHARRRLQAIRKALQGIV